MAVKRYSGDKFTGLSSDTKPSSSDLLDGAIFHELDTNKIFQLHSDSWTEIGYSASNHSHSASDISDVEPVSATEKSQWDDAYTHSNVTTGNPHNLSPSDIGAAADSHSHSNATTSSDGFMSSSDKSKLNGIESGAEVNTVDSVNGETGTVSLSASDVDAVSASSGGTFGGKVNISNGGDALSITGNATGASNTGYLKFDESDGTRIGYIGDGTTGDNHLDIYGDNGIDLNVGSGLLRTQALLTAQSGIDAYSSSVAGYAQYWYSSNGNYGARLYVDGATGNGNEGAFLRLDNPSSSTNTHAVIIDSRLGNDSYFNSGGNVGIGTTSPNAKLDVNGNINASGGTFSGVVSFDSNIEFCKGSVGSGAGTRYLRAGINTSGDGRTWMAPTTDGSSDFGQEFGFSWGNDNWYFDDTLRVGGTFTAQGGMEIVENSPSLYFDETDTTDENFWLGKSGNFQIQVRDDSGGFLRNPVQVDPNAGSNSLYIGAGGISLGHNSPSEALDVSGNILASGSITAQGNQTVWHEGNDGAGSGLDADMLDGNHASAFSSADTITLSHDTAGKIGEVGSIGMAIVLLQVGNSMAVCTAVEGNVRNLHDNIFSFEVDIGTPTGTTGNDNTITLFVNSSGEIYIEHRESATNDYNYTIITT